MMVVGGALEVYPRSSRIGYPGESVYPIAPPLFSILALRHSFAC